MTCCPRCGTGLQPGAAICTACCQRLDDAAATPVGTFIDSVTPGLPEVVLPADTDEEARRATHALTHWPFGGADDETVNAVTQASAQASTAPDASAPPAVPPAAPVQSPENDARRQQLAAQYAALDTPEGLGIPNQRSAAFNPLQARTAPPPNRYLEATRRQQANFGTTKLQLEDSHQV